jgi:hypothetical protein
MVRTEMPHLPNEAAAGTDVDVRGWIVDPDNMRVEAAWLDIAGSTVPIELNRTRVDVARTLGAEDRGVGFGFDTTVRLPDDVPPGLHDARIIGRTFAGRGVYAQTSQRVRIAHSRRAPRQFINGDAAPPFSVRVGDTQAAPHTLGRGAHTIRQESSLRVSGLVEHARSLHVVATPAAGPAEAWEFTTDDGGRFDATLWTGGLERGLYELVFSLPREDGAAMPVAACSIEVAGPHYIPPLHLRPLLTTPVAEIRWYGDAGARAASASAETLTSGRPIGIAGWCVDPVASEAPLAVYAEIDGGRPVPLSHHLPDPRGGDSTLRCGFGGIVDTTRLAPGEHRLRLLAVAVSGAGWYVIDDHLFVLADHRSASPVC